MFSTSALPPQFEQSATLDEFTWVLVAVLFVHQHRRGDSASSLGKEKAGQCSTEDAKGFQICCTQRVSGDGYDKDLVVEDVLAGIQQQQIPFQSCQPGGDGHGLLLCHDEESGHHGDK